MLKLSAFAAPFVALAILASPAVAEDTMAAGGMISAMDPMATECIEKAEAEADAMKMDAMMTECAKMYPEDVAAHCMMKAGMETDSMKKDEMMAACEAMVPGAMQSAM